MPKYDGTGPRGIGAGTGWSLGPCGGGMGYRRGFGRGYGFRRVWTKKDEVGAMEEEQKILEEELKVIREELKSLKGQK